MGRDDLCLRYSDIFIEAKHDADVKALLTDTGYITETDNDGNIIHFDFNGSNMPDDEELWNALAPYMRDGSFLEICDETGYIWRWVFSGGNYSSSDAIIIWPKPDTPRDVAQKIYEAFSQQLMPE